MTLQSFRNYFKAIKRDPEVNPVTLLLKTFFFHLQKRKIFTDHTTTIKQAKNIDTTNGELHIGRLEVGFVNHYDRTYMNIQGQLIIFGDVFIGRGCRMFVGKSAKCILTQCSITAMTNFIIENHLEIGRGTRIAWGCEFLDNDWHNIYYEGKIERDNGIFIGERVWLGSHVKVLKGVSIGNGCVVGAGSVLTKSFPENVLIAGNPAKILKENIHWD